jgi:uncharacterized protein (DUF2062 family)
MLDDSQHSIALGTALGMFIALTPTVGIQMMLVMILALATRPFFLFNRVAALLTVYVSNPLTIVPIYYFLYKVGTLFVEGKATREQIQSILDSSSLGGWWDSISALVVDIGSPLLIGTAIVATLSGLLTYPLMRLLLRTFRQEQPPTN